MPKCVWLPRKSRGRGKPKPKPLRPIRSSDGDTCSPCCFACHLTRKIASELNKVYTNGTLVDEQFLTDEQAGHCISITEATSASTDGSDPDSERRFGVCVLDCSTSEFNLSSFEDDVCRTRLETLLRQICPKELLYKKVCGAGQL